MAANLIDFTDRRIAEIDAEVAKRLMAAALALQAEEKRSLSTANPPPHANSSKPGEYPKARTYNLRDAVAIDPPTLAGIRAGGFRVRVGYLASAWYIVPLSQRKRLNVIDTANRIAGRIRTILG